MSVLNVFNNSIVPNLASQFYDPYRKSELTIPKIYECIIKGVRAVANKDKSTPKDLISRVLAARIIDFSTETFNVLAESVANYLLSLYPGLDLQSYVKDFFNKQYDDNVINISKSYKSFLDVVGKKIILPIENLPFDHVLLMFGIAGGVIDNNNILVAVLVSYDSNVYYFIVDLKNKEINISEEYVKGQWTSPSTFTSPWIVKALVKYLGEYRTFIEEQTTVNSYKKPAKGKKWYKKKIPQPYYTVTVKSEIIKEDFKRKETGLTFKYSHRFDRRGHERCYVRTGNLPLLDSFRENLVRKGYRIYTSTNFTDDDLVRINERGKKINLNEWIAIKHRWIESDVIPHRPELPYVPAIRRLSKRHRPETKE
ncbi:MAG: hypothetical protein WC942_11815 [Clostridia bacterium]|jgi:hypothetical protein